MYLIKNMKFSISLPIKQSDTTTHFLKRKSGKIVQIGYQPSNGKALQANTKIQKIKYSEGKFQSGGHS